MATNQLHAPIASGQGGVGAGIVVTGAAQGVKFIAQLISVVVLSRLLAPADFGVVAMIAPVLVLVGMFQDLGFAHATVQRLEITHAQVSAMFWVNALAGVLSALILVGVAPLIGELLNDQRVVGPLMAMGPVSMAGALTAQHNALLQRQMRFKRLALIDVTGAFAGLIGAIVGALWIGNYWALVLGGATSVCVTAAGLVISARWTPAFSLGLARGMASFGAGVTSFNLTNFVARNADNLIIGRALGAEALGLYDRAYKLLLFPLQQINVPLWRVMIPALSRLQDDQSAYARMYGRISAYVAMAAAPGVVALAIDAHDLVRLALGPGWEEVGTIFRLLAVAGLAQLFNNTIAWLFISQGRTSALALWGLINAASALAAFWFGVQWGLAGLALAYACSEVAIRTPILFWMAGACGPVRRLELFAIAFPLVLASLFAATAAFGASTMLEQAPLVARLAAAAMASYAGFGVGLLVTPRGRVNLGDLGADLHALLRKMQSTHPRPQRVGG